MSAFRLALAVTASVVLANVVSPVWRWYVEPLGLPGISVAQAYGLIAVIALLQFHSLSAQLSRAVVADDLSKEENQKAAVIGSLAVIITAPMSLAFLALVHHLWVA